jgi:CheY-like chemotaxis protein
MDMIDDQEPISGGETTTVKTVLVVEDDPDVGEFMVQALKQETPYHPLLASDGFQALKVVREIKADLLLLDYRLPGMNGLELYDRLHTTKEIADIPTIMISANLPLREARERKITCLKKPIELDELLDTIEQFLA